MPGGAHALEQRRARARRAGACRAAPGRPAVAAQEPDRLGRGARDAGDLEPRAPTDVRRRAPRGELLVLDDEHPDAHAAAPDRATERTTAPPRSEVADADAARRTCGPPGPPGPGRARGRPDRRRSWSTSRARSTCSREPRREPGAAVGRPATVSPSAEPCELDHDHPLGSARSPRRARCRRGCRGRSPASRCSTGRPVTSVLVVDAQLACRARRPARSCRAAARPRTGSATDADHPVGEQLGDLELLGGEVHAPPRCGPSRSGRPRCAAGWPPRGSASAATR